ncbi:MAG: anti-sigma factor antagonist [Spirochaetota bacterium]
MNNNDIVPGFDEEKDESLRIKLQQVEGVDGALVMYLSGYIDTYNSSFFQKRVNRAVDAGYSKLIFNCGGLNYVSSTGIGSFTAFLKAVKPRGGDIVLLEIQPRVYEVFQLLGFSQFFTIMDTLEEATNFFQKSTAIPATDMFPKTFKCPVCSTRLRANRAGRFRCSKCRTILAIDQGGQVYLG